MIPATKQYQQQQRHGGRKGYSSTYIFSYKFSKIKDM